ARRRRAQGHGTRPAQDRDRPDARGPLHRDSPLDGRSPAGLLDEHEHPDSRAGGADRAAPGAAAGPGDPRTRGARRPRPPPPPAPPSPAVDAPARDRPASAPVAAIAAHEEPVALREAPANPRREPADEQAKGALLFAKEWVPDDPMSHGGDGLGPVFNDTSCVACHGLGAPGGGGPENKNVVILTVRSPRKRIAGELMRIHPGLVSAGSTVLHRFRT